MPPELRIVANGIDALTGRPLVPSLTAATLAARIRQGTGGEPAAWLKRAGEAADTPMLGLPFDIEPGDLPHARWAVVTSTTEPAATLTALKPLIEHRRTSIGDEAVALLDHRPGEDVPTWLGRHGVMPGGIDPSRVPFYLMLVGPPTRIPFDFQELLDVEYAVGRLDLGDAAAYERYARSVAEHETSVKPLRDTSASLLATRHEGDPATELSADRLVAPLAAALAPDGRIGSRVQGLQVNTRLGPAATRAAYLDDLRGSATAGRPALLFSATHGLAWPALHPEQRDRQGALLCADWPGQGPASASTWLAGDDVPDDAQVHGLVAFLFACFGAGTPAFDAFEHEPGQAARPLAAEPFVAALPRALLAHRNGGAVAVLGHVERTWESSFVLESHAAAAMAFQNAIGTLLIGRPVGLALRDLNERFAVVSAQLGALLERSSFGLDVPDDALVTAWLERNDAGGYVLLGDPMTSIRLP